MTTEHTSDPGRTHPITRFSLRVQEVLDDLTDVPEWSMTAEEQRTALVELSRAETRLTALRLRVLAAADANAVGTVDASPSTAAWVAHSTRQTRPAAHADLRLATALQTTCPATGAALAEGRVNTAQARAITRAVADLPDCLDDHDRARAEAHLLALAAEHDAAELALLGKKLFEVLDPDAADERLGAKLAEEERQAQRRTFLKLRDNGDGTTSGAFKIPALHAAMLTKALDALISPRRPDGPRSRQSGHGDSTGTPGRPELLGMGLCELIERYPVRRLPTGGGANATVVVTMTLEQLLSGLGAAHLDTGGLISADEARRLACTAGVIPAVLGGRSEVLDLGRRKRLHTRAQRLALTLQHRVCTEQHCDRPAGWCHAHHKKAWATGGGTSVADGLLLCPWHHHRAHDPAYDMTTMTDGSVRFARRQ